jgi:hypothetical protein
MIHLEITNQEYQFILNNLATLPFNQVFQFINKLEGMARDQIDLQKELDEKKLKRKAVLYANYDQWSCEHFRRKQSDRSQVWHPLEPRNFDADGQTADR